MDCSGCWSYSVIRTNGRYLRLTPIYMYFDQYQMYCSTGKSHLSPPQCCLKKETWREGLLWWPCWGYPHPVNPGERERGDGRRALLPEERERERQEVPTQIKNKWQWTFSVHSAPHLVFMFYLSAHWRGHKLSSPSGWTHNESGFSLPMCEWKKKLQM